METCEHPLLDLETLPVLILPMRNGNFAEKYASKNSHISGSYPTYEEWKLVTTSSFSWNSYGSYPTYEEWKLQYF